MAKKRKGISKALKKGKVESGFTINESPDDDLGFGTPKTKEKNLSQAAKEQNEFNSRYSFSADVNSKNYDNSKGEVPEEYAGAVNSWSDYRMVPKTREEDKVDASKMGPESSGKSIPSGVNYTSPSSSKSDKIYNNGFNVVDILRRKGYHAGTIFDESDRPTLDNPMGKGLDPKMDKMSTKEAGKVDSKQGSALVGATKKTEETTQNDPEMVKQASKLGETINSNPSPQDRFFQSKKLQSSKISPEEAPYSGSRKFLGPDDGSITYSPKVGGVNDDFETANLEAIQRQSLLTAIKPTPEENIQNGQKLVETISSDANNTVTDKVILEQIQNAESPEEIAKIKADAEAAKIEEQKQKEQLANENKSAIQTTIGVINEDQKGKRPSFDQVTTIQDVQRGVLDQYRNQASQVPYAVVEKLGIQDYYPNAGRDIAVGTFSGSRIGSQTIYSGAGALLPVGLYDARKRSLVEAAKAVQKKKDEFLQVPDAPQQFNADFQQAAYSELYDIGAKHGWNMNAIMKDKEAMKRVYAIKNAAKDLAYTDEIVDNIFETLNTADGKTASYVPEDVLQAMIEYRQGKLDVESILSGDSNVLELAGKIRNYANVTQWADKNLPEWKSDPASLPLNLKTDKPITEQNLNELQSTYEKAKISGDYSSYITATKEYFHLDPAVVNAWVAQNMVGATEAQKAEVIKQANDYIFAQMPPASIKESITNLKTDALGWARLAFDKQKDKEEKETVMTRAINTANEAKLKDRISAINNDTSLNTPEKKRAALMKAYRDAGFTPYHNKTTGEVYGSVSYSAADKKMNVIYPADRTQVWVKPKGKNQQYKWEPINKVLANRNGYVLDSKDINELDSFQKGGSMGSINESRMFETYYDGVATRKVNIDNISKYASSQRKGIGTEAVGNIVVTSEPDENGNVVSTPGRMQIKVQLLPETNPTDRQTLDAMFSTEKQKVSTDRTFNAAGPDSNY
jgi:hypothetical protein